MGQMSELHIKMQDELMNTIHKAEEGHITMLDALLALEGERKQLETSVSIVKSFKDDHFEQISNEAENYKDGYKGHDIEVRNGGKLYDFKHIPEWQQAEKSKKGIEDKYKAMLNAKIKGAVHADVSEDGEELPLPEISYRKSSIIVKKKKN